MAESWMRGWLPRVTAQNRKGFAQALEPATLFDAQVRPAGAVVDAPSAMSDPEILEPLRAEQIPFVLDTSSWRFADERTWQSPKWSRLPYSPAQKFAPTREWVTAYVRAELASQDGLGPSAFLLPAWFLSDADQAHDVAHWTVEAALAVRGRDVRVRPLIAQISALRRYPEAARAATEGFGDDVVGTFMQVDNSDPRKEPVDRLSATVGLLLSAAAPDRPVVGLRLAAMAPVLLAVGVDGVTSGPASGERFSASTAIRGSLPRHKTDEDSSGGGAGVRMFFAEIEHTLGGKALRAVMVSRESRSYLQCKRSCHRFGNQLPQNMATADCHSILSRVEQGMAVLDIPAGMRIDKADRMLAAASTRLDGLNAALGEAKETVRISRDHLDHLRTLLAGAAQGRGVA